MYVNQETGTNKKTCGRSQSTPCKDLAQGVKRAKTSGTVHIIGDIHLLKRVFLRNSISITAERQQDGITAKENFRHTAFDVPCTKKPISVSLTRIRFDSVQVIKLHKCGQTRDIDIDNIILQNVTKPAIEGSSDTPLYSLRIKNSHFINSRVVKFLRLKEFLLENCIVEAQKFPPVVLDICKTVRIVGCEFRNSAIEFASPDITGVINAEKCGSLRISESRFYNLTSRNRTGSAVLFRQMKRESRGACLKNVKTQR